MEKPTQNKTIGKINMIIGGNLPLSTSIHKSISTAIKSRSIHLVEGRTEWEIFNTSLNEAIRNIEEHPRGKLFRRLIKHGPPNPDDPEKTISDKETTLSDPECGKAVQFIFSHMVNRFKGELAELLALKPCQNLTMKLKKEGLIPSNTQLFCGDTIKERRRITIGSKGKKWGGFTKGADGMLVLKTTTLKNKPNHLLQVLGIIEIKSMPISRKKILEQINNHAIRLRGGVKLEKKEYSSDKVNFSNANLIKIMVVPSNWKLNREWHYETGSEGQKVMVFPEYVESPVKTRTEKLKKNLYKITLAWSKEALEQAAYEMTFWYMSQVGKHVFSEGNLPKGWENMTPEQAGYNAIKMMLYYIPLRHQYITKRQDKLAIKLYNVYSFGYPLGVDSKQMLWPEDIQEIDSKKDIYHK